MKKQFNKACYENWSMGWAWRLSTPIGGIPTVTNAIAAQHPIPTSAGEWDEIFNAATNASELLWAASLNYMVDLHKHDSTYAVSALRAFYDAFWRSFHEIAETLGSSWDHCSSMRLKTLTALTGSGDTQMEQLAYQYLRKETDAEDYWRLIERNNHGLMLLDALIGVSLVSADSSVSLKRAATELERILGFVFGDDGFCNENSPAYHHLYVRLVEDFIAKYRDRTGCECIVETAEKYLVVIKPSMSKIVKPNGDIPPLGDSNPSGSKYESVSGTFFSERVGLWVYKLSSLYLTFTCGFENLTHKHADDTSITLSYRGEDLITDAGTASYNYGDPRILGLRTQKGHSGVYFKRFDNYHPAKLYGKGIEAKSVMLAANASSVRGGYMISGNHIAHRHLTVVSPTRIRIEDHCSSISHASSVIRFIVPNHVAVGVESSGFRLYGKSVSANVTFSEKVRVRVAVGETEEPHRGWISIKPNETIPAQCVEVSRSVCGRGKLVHTIDLIDSTADGALKPPQGQTASHLRCRYVGRFRKFSRLIYKALKRATIRGMSKSFQGGD